MKLTQNQKYYLKTKDRKYTEEQLNQPRVCIKCNRTLLSKNFIRKPALTDGFDKKCKLCRTIERDNYERSQKTNYRMDLYYRRTYNMSFEEVEEFKLKRNNLCEICGGSSIKMNIDHCHDTGKIRGLLCHHCNLGIGNLKENIKVLESAINYLKIKGDKK